MASILPLETAEHILDFLHDDIPALAACALASRALLHGARFHIWREIAVPVRTYPVHSRMQGFVEILHANADIAPLVVSLTLKGVLSPQPRNRIQQRWDDPEGTVRLWEKLPNLRVLRFVFLRFSTGLHQLLPVAYSLPNLEEIAVVDSIAILSREYSTRPSYGDSVVTKPPTPTKLKTLKIAGGSTAWSFLEDLAKLLLEPGMHAPLETLDLSCIVRSGNFKYATWDRTDALPSQAWAPVIASLGTTLRHCTLGLLAVECSPGNIANLYESLKQCTLLQSLSIQCNVLISPTETGSHSPFIFIDMLAEALSSPAGLHSQFSELNTLSIAWLTASGPVPPACVDACKKLARALEDRSRCPLLKRLTVSVGAGGATSEGFDAQREEVEAQGSVLRSCFEPVISAGVQVQVDISVAGAGHAQC